MNPSTDQASVAVDELAPPSQPQRLSTSCDIHPNERFSGFCPSCLCERLSVLDNTGAPPQPPSSSSRKPPNISAGALKSLFKPSSSSNNNNNANGRIRPGFFPELRRTKSFSAKNNEGFSGGFEPQRRSCDVRLRDEATTVIEDDGTKSSVSEAVFEVNEDEEAETEEEEGENGGHRHSEIVNNSGEKSGEVVEEMKPMKDYMDLYPPQTKKPSFAGSLFSAASVFNKKLQKWRQKQKKTKKSRNGGRERTHFPVEKATQSETAEYGFGRRSSDTDPRFSLDAGRFSVDIGRISLDDSRFDEPRASWDGHLTGRSVLPPAARVPPPPSMLSVVKNAPVNRSDMKIPINGGSDPVINIPGGSNQTRAYYTDLPPSRRRKSLDRSNSIKKTITTEIEDFKSVSSNSKVSPAITERDDDYSMENKLNQNGDNNKKSRRWGKWSILGFIYRKGVNKDDEDDRYSRRTAPE